jgi:hypothetical protein
MIRSVPTLDPHAHRAAIDALEAQRAAYRRYARAMEVQQQSFGDGDGDHALAAAEAAARGFDELQVGAGRLQPLVERATKGASTEELLEVQRQMEALMRDARAAEVAIQNMTVQLEAWRDAYGRQLAELGVTPGSVQGSVQGSAQGSASGGGDEATASNGYGPRGVGTSRTVGTVPSLIDRRG